MLKVPTSLQPRHLVLWDGDCGFCRRSVEWLAANDRRHALEFKPYQDANLAPTLKEACSHAVHVITTDGQVLSGGRAMLFCGQFTRWGGWARIAQWPIFMPFINVGYKFIARNRNWISNFFFTRERPEQYERVTE